MNKKRVIIFLISVAIFLLFILTTSPNHMPLILILVPGIALIVAVQSLLSFIVSHLPLTHKTGKVIVHVFTIILAVIGVLLSVGQLTFRDFALLLTLALIGMFYLSRMFDR